MNHTQQEDNLRLMLLRGYASTLPAEDQAAIKLAIKSISSLDCSAVNLTVAVSLLAASVAIDMNHRLNNHDPFTTTLQ